MKKNVLLCALVLVLVVLVAAPASAAIKLKFGLKAGVSISDVKWTDDVGDESSLVQPTFGGFVLVPLGSVLDLQPEVNYLVMGEKWASETYGTVSEKFTYLQIPVLLRARLMKEGKFVPVLFAGPAFSFLLSANETGYGDITDFIKSTDFGAIFGAGGEIAAGKMKVLLDLRYVMGLSNDYIEPADIGIMAIPTEWSMKTAAFVLSVGVIF